MFPVMRESRLFPVFQPVNRLEAVFERVPDMLMGRGVAVWQDEENLFVEVDLPGVAESDLDVTVHQGQLFVRGERKVQEGRKYLHNSQVSGRFARTVTLPEDVQNDKVAAEFVNGVLRITLPKRPEAQPKRITVQSK